MNLEVGILPFSPRMGKSPRLAEWLLALTAIGAGCSPFFAFRRAVCFAATVLAREKRPVRASLRPLDIHEYVFESQSCATRLVFAGSAPLAAAKQAALATLVEFGPVARNTARDRSSSSSIPLATSRAHGVFARHLRRDASSAEYRLPRLACICRRIRRTAREVLAYLLLVSPPAPQ